MSGTDETRVEHGSGNGFADLGRPEAEIHLLKAELVPRIDQIIRERRLPLARASLAWDVEMIIRKPHTRRQGGLSVEAE